MTCRKLSLQPPLLTSDTYDVPCARMPSEEVPAPFKGTMAFNTPETLVMPLGPKRRNDHVDHRLLALDALAASPVGVTTDAPRIPVAFDERYVRSEGIAALSAEKVARVV